MIWQQVIKLLNVHRHELIIILVAMLAFLFVWPVGEYAILDDWAFVKSLEHFHFRGELVVMDWNPMSLTGHLVWGLLFTKCFGFSFLVTKVSVFCAGVLLALIVYWFSKQHGTNSGLALLASLALLLNPLFLVHSYMYMTDVTGLLWQWLSVGSLSLGLAKQGRQRAWLLGTSSILWALAFLTRQHGITAPLAFGAYVLLFDRSRLRLGILAPAFLPGVWLAANGLAWHSLTQGDNQAFRTSAALVREFVLNPPWLDLPYIGWSYAVYMGLFAAPMILSIRWHDLRPLTTGRHYLILAATWIGILLFFHYSMKGWYFPYVNNVVTPWGMFHPHEFVIGDRNLLWDREWGMTVGLCGILSAVAWLALVCRESLTVIPMETGHSSQQPLNAGRLLLLLFGFQMSYVFVTAPILYDRHLLLLAPTVIALSALAASQHSSPKRFAPGLVLVGYAMYGIVCTHDIHAISRAAFLEGQRLLSIGVRPERIDAGYAFDGWHMYERSQSISRAPALRLPPWWPSSRPVVQQEITQPWWIDILATQIRPEYVVTISSPIPVDQFRGQYRFEEIESEQRFGTYWPWREQRTHVFRCHPISAVINPGVARE